MLKYDTFYLLYTSWEWQFKFNTAVRGFLQLVALILYLSLVPKKKREDWTHRRCKEYEQLQNVSMYVYSIVYNIESAAATK